MSVLLCVFLATAAAAPTEAAMGEAYARAVNAPGNQQYWAQRAKFSEPVAVMDRFEDRARRAAEEAPAPGLAPRSLARKLGAGAGGAAAAGPSAAPSPSAAMPPAGSPAVSAW